MRQRLNTSDSCDSGDLSTTDVIGSYASLQTSQCKAAAAAMGTVVVPATGLNTGPRDPEAVGLLEEEEGPAGPDDGDISTALVFERGLLSLGRSTYRFHLLTSLLYARTLVHVYILTQYIIIKIIIIIFIRRILIIIFFLLLIIIIFICFLLKGFKIYAYFLLLLPIYIYIYIYYKICITNNEMKRSS